MAAMAHNALMCAIVQTCN